MNIFRKFISVFIAGFLMIFIGFSSTPSYDVLDSENCQLNFAVLSDVHVEGNNFETFKNFGKILKGIKKNKNGVDSLVFLGDNTMNGQEIESILFYGLLSKLNPSKNTIVACGNHDVGNGEGDYNTLINRYMGFNNALLDANIDKPYFYRVIDGYYFIVLGPEALCINSPAFSDERFEFLAETMALAKESGKPIFIFNHHPIYNFRDGNYEKFFNVVSKYENVFYFSGHTHMAYEDGWTFEEFRNVHTINLPRSTEGYDDNGPGYGVDVEVYNDRVVCRFRNYINGVSNESQSYTFPITK